MRLELQQIGTLCVALLLGGSTSLCLFFVIIFLIRPDKALNRHMRRAYFVAFVATDHKNRTKKTPDKRIAMPNLSSSPELTPIRANAPQKVSRKMIHARLPNIDQINVASGGLIHIVNLDSGTGPVFYSKDIYNMQFNGVEKRYSTSSKGNSQPPERFRIIGGGEIDRIGNTCFEAPSVGGIGSRDTGQTGIEKDLNQDHAMNSLTAHQVPCNKADNSLARDFLKQLEKRGLIMAPVSATN